MKQILISTRLIITITVALLLSALFAIFAITPVSAVPTTFTVTNTNDSGAGSFRQAILDANANDNIGEVDTIEFNIPGSGTHTISLTTNLPNIVEPVLIDGYSQTGSVENSAATPLPFNGSPTIVLESIATGIYFDTGSDNSTLRGVIMHSFLGDGGTNGQVTIASDGVTVTGSYIGVLPDGLSQPDVDPVVTNRNSTALLVLDDADGTIIGGTNPQDRNIFAGKNSGVASVAFKGTSTLVYGNYFHLGRDGVTDLGGLVGVSSVSGDTVYGGAEANKKNVMSGADTVNLLFLNPSTNITQGNYIGTDYTGEVNSSITNGIGVVATAGASGNLIGGTGASEGNVITGAGSGVAITSLTINAYGPLVLTSTNNTILGNSIKDISIFDYLEFGTSNVGIDLFSQVDESDPADFIPDVFSSQGPNENDSSDTDTGSNGLINTPVLKTAQQISPTEIAITYDLDAADSPSDTYRIEFFANDESSIFGTGPGEEFLGAVAVSANGTDLPANLTVAGDYTNKAISATATAIDGDAVNGFGSTSEFSQNISIGSITDFDADGISDAVEQDGPNGGDGNGDSIDDYLQPTVTTYMVAGTDTYVTLVTEGCSENDTVASVEFVSLNVKDNGFAYPYGLVDFTLNCSRGDTVDVDMYVHEDTNPERYLPRKFNPNTEEFTSVDDAVLSTESIGAGTALKLSYSITDGGMYDDDGEENGVIVDPIGLAIESASTTDGSGPDNSVPGELSDTGANIIGQSLAALAVVILALVLGRITASQTNFINRS